MAEPRKYYNIPQVAEMMGVCETTVRRYIANGQLGCLKINGIIRIKPKHIDAFEELHEWDGNELANLDRTSSPYPIAENTTSHSGTQRNREATVYQLARQIKKQQTVSSPNS